MTDLGDYARNAAQRFLRRRSGGVIKTIEGGCDLECGDRWSANTNLDSFPNAYVQP
ncbi:hypothetical protein [Bradyrhizobium cenepequi]|uniref:hypothetical protein n=1 Tax=Bradyrhizobium cenepequi TaxID=2821403 RepID=UPI001CE2693E|nr:hypothetical protein [Bradyrhizobium cenepequi]MCA6110827.1 hypothetical protein [Bradyrhizobium cenepequi]